MTVPTASSASNTAGSDSDYPNRIAPIQAWFTARVQERQGRAHLFTTRSEGLFDVYLDAMPPALRLRYTCQACRRFIERYGGLVVVETDGRTVPVMWDPGTTDEPLAPAFRALAAVVARAPITGVFLSADKIWGQPQTGVWRHIAVVPPESCVHRPSAVQSTAQAAAEKLQDHATLLHGLEEYPIDVVRKAHALLASEALYRSEKCVGAAKWLLDLHEQRSSTNPRVRDNLTWLAVAGAPPGLCHVRSGMIGTLLADISAGLPFADIKARFDAKMNPLQYQRPTAAPTAGNIAEAEKIIAKLRTAGALERRFARLADIVPLWLPRRGKQAPPTGVFAKLKAKKPASAAEVDVPPVTMTWEKFARTVLPTAGQIEYLVPASNQAYVGMVTAKNPKAPPIVQWDQEDRRNPVTWYFYLNGSTPARWNLQSGVYHPVTAITLQPSMWHSPEKYTHQGQKVIFILAGARDTEYKSGAGFFPEVLKSEYHPIRATLEAYANNAVVEDKDSAEACGLGLSKGAAWDLTFRVTTKGGLRLLYKLDRWD